MQRFRIKISFLFILFILLGCKDHANNIADNKELLLPSESQISKVLKSKEDYTLLNDLAKSKGYLNAKEYQQKIANDVSNEEFQFYYKKYKPNGLENLGVEALANERRKILNRLAWTKMIEEVNIRVELREIEFKKIDWKQISTEDDPTIGNQFAPITVFEFSDFECTFCSKSQKTSKEIRAKYGKKIFWVFKDFPLQEIHTDAFRAHVSANCVKHMEPTKYWEHFNTLFENYRSLEKENLIEYVRENGIDEKKWDLCMKDSGMQKKIISEIQSDLKEGKSLGIKGTPTFIVNGNIIVGARDYDFLTAIIEKELKNTVQ
ncbi:MAG TPA: thioredoxin domain-containing protein [Leptospiraceae bacterium]|nr:thioredoxin domain-containing protein [Leptospiraceae bacterium]HMW06507.1 thioredoxin domain-containing protein [Leptospiraceae bacterium]HMX33248.1 thioredoxin domain-containing protein [Leptospiraceae bacterium]HMY32855.1 thioredoxin domain-containing protein [Leptospiraceae bacterium]HMZ66094.1 thioredoxin domain-containing protein [Leptospiraceae bacterium]